LWWTADPPRPFQLRPVPICSALRFLVTGLPPVFIYRRFHVYLKEPRIPIESPLWYDRFFWQNPVRVTRPVPPGRLPFSSTFLPSGGSAFRCIRIPYASSLSALAVRFRSVDHLLPVPVLRPSPLAPDLSIFPVRFQSYDLLRPSCDSNLAIGRFLSTGDSNYSHKDKLSKPEGWQLGCFSKRKSQ
jgi:hypothetical protein